MEKYCMQMDPPNMRSGDEMVSGALRANSFAEAMAEAYEETRRVACSRPSYEGKLSYRIRGMGMLLVSMEFDADALRALPDPLEERKESLSIRRDQLRAKIEQSMDRANFWKDQRIGDSQYAKAQSQRPRLEAELSQIESELAAMEVPVYSDLAQ